MSLDLAPALREAIVLDADTGGAVTEWNGEPAVFTRRPVPEDAPAKMIMINPDSAITDEDFLDTEIPVVMRTIVAYGNQPTDYRSVEAIGYALRVLFHRQKSVIRPVGYDVIDIVASGPFPAPVDDDKTVARAVGLKIRLRRQT